MLISAIMSSYCNCSKFNTVLNLSFFPMYTLFRFRILSYNFARLASLNTFLNMNHAMTMFLRSDVLLLLSRWQAYFTDGEFLDVDRLLHYATQAGLDPDQSRQVLTDPDSLERTASRARAWRTKDVTGQWVDNRCYNDGAFLGGSGLFSSARHSQIIPRNI